VPKARIILADDDELCRAMLGELLTEAGYEVLPAANGNEALLLCEKQGVAVAILDLVMPEKEGLETIREMRRRFPHIKTIAISGSDSAYLEGARHLGAASALAKPFANADLLKALDNALGFKVPSWPLHSPRSDQPLRES
jgi:CheY-like chemotaxis protein